MDGREGGLPIVIQYHELLSKLCRPGIADGGAPSQFDMPITYTIDHDEKLITEVWTGEVQATDLAAHWRQYLADPEVMALRRTIVDLRQADVRLSGSDLDALIRGIVLPALKGRDWKTALVVEGAAQFGLGRQYHAFADCYSKDAIFQSMEEARDWINEIG